MIKWIINFSIGVFLLIVFCRIFYYWILPYLVGQYRRARGHEIKYDKEIKEIKKGKL